MVGKRGRVREVTNGCMLSELPLSWWWSKSDTQEFILLKRWLSCHVVVSKTSPERKNQLTYVSSLMEQKLTSDAQQ